MGVFEEFPALLKRFSQVESLFMRFKGNSDGAANKVAFSSVVLGGHED